MTQQRRRVNYITDTTISTGPSLRRRIKAKGHTLEPLSVGGGILYRYQTQCELCGAHVYINYGGWCFGDALVVKCQDMQRAIRV
jgi:hypothetical protein